MLGRRPRPTLLVLVDLIQDVDVLLPVLLAAREAGWLQLKVAVSSWLKHESPRTERLLAAYGMKFGYARRRDIVDGAAPSLRGIHAVLTAAESSHPAHAAGHALVQRATAAGMATYGLQHGLENAGLFGIESNAGRFASGTVFCWFPEAAVPPGLAPETRRKLVHIGRPEPPGGWRRDAPASYDVGVFENLHWSRYDDADRQGFRDGLTTAVRELPDVHFFLRPHPAGGWGNQLRHELAAFKNITQVPAHDERDALDGGGDILQRVKRVITTPSTVALDAALAGKPTALGAAGGTVYDPLPVLKSSRDWVRFAAGGSFDTSALDRFSSRVLVSGDSAPRIVERLRQDLLSPSLHAHG